MVGVRHPMVDDYLRRLERAARVLGQRDHDELVGDLRARLDAVLGSDPSEADIRKALDALGIPEEIVGTALPAGWAPQRPGAREVVALVLLLGLVPLAWPKVLLVAVPWLAGVALLELSPLWSRRQKLLGGLAWPAGIGLPFALARLILGPDGPSLRDPVVLLAVTVPAVALAVYLYRVAGRRWLEPHRH